MTRWRACVLAGALLLLGVTAGPEIGTGRAVARLRAQGRQTTTQAEPQPLSQAAQVTLVKTYCVTCHTDAQKPGGITFEQFKGAKSTAANIAALMVRKLKAGQMPPPGMPRPDQATVNSFITALEAAAVPGSGEALPAVGPKGPRIVPFPHKGDLMSVATQNAMVHQICTQCHTDQRKPGGLSFQHVDMATLPTEHPEIAEDMIAKLRAGMMPKQGAPVRPDLPSIHAFVVSLEGRIDRAAALHPDPGRRRSQRLNRVEYARTIKTMLGLDVDVSQWLPPDTMSHNFDNFSEAQTYSPTLLQGYLDAANEISRLAVGDPEATASSASYSPDNFASQVHHVAGAPAGTRGGMSVVHIFPADGTYRFKLLFFGTPAGDLYGLTSLNQEIEISVNDRRVALLPLDPKQLNELRPQGLTLTTGPIEIKAGPQRIAAAFLDTGEGPVDDLVAPHRFTLADTQIGEAQGVTTVPHLRTLTITGPLQVTGVSDTVSRRRIFICRPLSAADEDPCARKILTHLAAQAYRQPPTTAEVNDLMKFFHQGRANGGFEAGIRVSLQAMLLSTHFLFRLEPEPATVRAGQNYRVSDLALASRLSYFLWATPPDAELVKLATAGRLHEPAVLVAQVKRMLADPRSYALSTRFAAQWLRLQDLYKVHPDAFLYAEYDGRLADEMQEETERFFDSLVKGDRNVLDLLTADYTYVNQDLANFYGIRGVAGTWFRKVSLAGTHRRGLLGQGSILVETSIANRSDPVLRGKWVLEVLLGQPPPPPPPNVDTNLDDSAKAVENGKALSVRQRMEEHRANPFCASCHSVIDPIGIALENFGPDGHWRIRDNGVPIDASTTLYDGTKMDGLDGLDAAMLKHQDTFLRVFTENLMAYALGRQIEYFDMPTVRAIVRRAAANGDRFSSFVLGIVESDAFRMSRAPGTVTTASTHAERANRPASKGRN